MCSSLVLCIIIVMYFKSTYAIYLNIFFVFALSSEKLPLKVINTEKYIYSNIHNFLHSLFSFNPNFYLNYFSLNKKFSLTFIVV